jgi:predicted N-acetyltransferase YhbS
MSLQFRECRPEELPTVVQRLDDEFVFSKNRTISLEERFPNVLSANNLQQIRVALSDGILCGALGIKLFDWVLPAQIGRGAMIGTVWVEPRFRRMGVGSILLRSSVEYLGRLGVDICVLWTGSPAFYERAGWVMNDRGVFGQAEIRSLSGPINSTHRRLHSIDPSWLESLRATYFPARIARKVVDYRAIPIPAIEVLCFSAKGLDGIEGFALVGERDRTGYLYEMVAPPSLWDAIWTGVAQRYNRLFVNGNSDEAFSQWLAGKRLVTWEPQNKAMWYRFSIRADALASRAFHISYFDWI